jgi:hypothetical protein
VRGGLANILWPKTIQFVRPPLDSHTFRPLHHHPASSVDVDLNNLLQPLL